MKLACEVMYVECKVNSFIYVRMLGKVEKDVDSFLHDDTCRDRRYVSLPRVGAQFGLACWLVWG